MTGLLKHSFLQISEVIRARQALTRAGISLLDPVYGSISRVENRVAINLGFRIPKPMTLLLRLFGLSPGEIKLWHDAESGWFTEAREKPGAPPVYHYVNDDTAMAILKGELTKEREAELMKPDEYVGE